MFFGEFWRISVIGCNLVFLVARNCSIFFLKYTYDSLPKVIKLHYFPIVISDVCASRFLLSAQLKGQMLVQVTCPFTL